MPTNGFARRQNSKKKFPWSAFTTVSSALIPQIPTHPQVPSFATLQLPPDLEYSNLRPVHQTTGGEQTTTDTSDAVERARILQKRWPGESICVSVRKHILGFLKYIASRVRCYRRPGAVRFVCDDAKLDQFARTCEHQHSKTRSTSARAARLTKRFPIVRHRVRCSW